MNPSDILRVEKNIVSADNASTIFGYSNTHPIMTFTIPNQDKFLVGSTVRLNGRIRIKTNSQVALQQAVNNNTNMGGVAQANIGLSNIVGVHGLISSITLNSTNNTTLERIQNYGRFVASILPAMHSQEDYDSALGCQSLVASKSLNGALLNNRATSFSCPLYTGLLMGTPLIPLSNTGTRGLRLQIELNADSMGLNPWLKTQSDAASGSTELTDFKSESIYEITDVTLSFDQVVPVDPAMASPPSGALQYNSVTNLYSVLRSSDETVNLNLSNSQTVSIYHNFIPANRINNKLHDSFKTTRPLVSSGNQVEITNVSATKGGLRFPLDYELITEAITDRPLANLLFNFTDSIKPMNRYNHSLISVNSTAPVVANAKSTRNMTLAADTYEKRLINPNCLSDIAQFGVGTSQDFLSRIGVNYKNTPYALRLQTDLNDATPNSMFTYTLSKNMLVYNGTGIQVMN